MKIRHELTPYFCETYGIDRDKDYPVEWIDPRTLLVSERLDLIAKLKYIEARENGGLTPFIKDCYIQHIAAFSYGTFKESGTKEKDSIEKYLDSFHQLIDAIAGSGFDAAKSVIPVGEDNILLDGAHRAAVAIHFKQQLPIIRIPEARVVYDADYFRKRLLDERCLDYLVLEYAKLKGTVQTALVLPGFAHQTNLFRQCREILNQHGKLVYFKNVPYPHTTEADSSKIFGSFLTKKESEPQKNSPKKISLILYETANNAELGQLRERVQQLFRDSGYAIHYPAAQPGLWRQLEEVLAAAESDADPIRRRISSKTNQVQRWLVYKSKVLLLRTLKHLGLFTTFRKLYRSSHKKA